MMEFSTECVVVGGGPAGYGAALAAGRGGCRTLLVERHGYLGGMGAAAGLSAFINYLYEKRVDLSDSVYRDLIREMRARGAWYPGEGGSVDYFDVETLKAVMEQRLAEEGVDILYHAWFDKIDATPEEHALRFVTKGGETVVRCKYVIDATGDADVCARAGVPMTFGKAGGSAQPMTMIVQLGGFDPVSYAASGGTLEEGKFACEYSARRDEIARARASGDWTIPREDIAMWWASPLDPTRITINGTRIQGLSGCDPADLSRGETEGRRQAGELARFFRKYVPGFEKSFLAATGPQIGVRETRRIVGRATLAEEDVLDCRQPEDSVCFCAYPIDIHNAAGTGTRFSHNEAVRYGIPYACLIPQKAENLLAAGRCISASHEAAGSFRVMATCMSLGEAAGTAVALASRNNRTVGEIPGSEVRAEMTGALNANTGHEAHIVAEACLF